LHLGRSDFAVSGVSCKVNEDVVRVLKDFHKAKKPVGLCCIAPVLAAKVLDNVTITLGRKGKKQNSMPLSNNLGTGWFVDYL
jgi:enhancing lycopene biosynthesis protein 2